MGYISSASTLSFTARLTSYGKQSIVNQGITNTIKTFALLDQDANYNTNQVLISGTMPSISGNLIDSATTNDNGCSDNVFLPNRLIVDSLGNTTKVVDSIQLTTSQNVIGPTTLIGTSALTHNIISLTSTTDPLTNLFSSFYLPFTTTQISQFTISTSNSGGYSDTCLSGISQNNVLIVAINNNNYGELIDGKSIHLSLKDTGSTVYDIYSAFRSGIKSNSTLDSQLTESSTDISNAICPNVVMLFSDVIAKPNYNASSSWSNGYNTFKPYSIGNKYTFNYKANSSVNVSADTIVGYFLVDSGFAIITNPTIISKYNTSTCASATSLTFTSVSNVVQSNITCVKERNQFSNSLNPSYSSANTLRISGIELFDSTGNIIAIGKTDRQIEISANSFLALNAAIRL